MKLFFAVGNTAFDAFIAAWDVKRFYDSSRPYSLVRFVAQLFGGEAVIGYLGPGKGFGTIPARQWHPYSPGTFVTPPFPGYVSGHSTVSAACAKTQARSRRRAVLLGQVHGLLPGRRRRRGVSLGPPGLSRGPRRRW